MHDSLDITASPPVPPRRWSGLPQTANEPSENPLCRLKQQQVIPGSFHPHRTQRHTQYPRAANRATNEYTRSASGAENYRRSLCFLLVSCVVADRAELLLFLAPDKAVREEVILYLFRLLVERITKRFERVELFLSPLRSERSAALYASRRSMFTLETSIAGSLGK